MPNLKITQLDAQTGANTASNDLVLMVDVSDTSMAASGTNKKLSITELQQTPVSAGTANGVLYLNGSKVATSGSGLTFDGTTLGVTGGISATGNITAAGTTAVQLAPGGVLQVISNLADDNAVIRSKGSGKILLNYGAGSGGVDIYNGTTSGLYASFSSTGLAVTGALSATTASGNNDLTVAATAGTPILSLIGVTGALPVIAYSGGSALRFGTVTGSNGAGFSEQMRLDASGNLGLGVTPSGWTLRTLQIGYGGFLGTTSATDVRANAFYDGANKYIGPGYGLLYQQNIGTGAHTWYTAPSGTAGDPITFGDPKMTLDVSGNLLVGTTSDNLFVDSGGFLVLPTATGETYFAVKHDSGTSTGATYGAFIFGTASIGSITQNGTTAVAYNTTSDHRLKTNVRPADALRFMDIEFVDFEWTDGRHDCGVIAHQLASIYPDLVLGEKDATEVRTVEITPAVPAVTEQRLVTPAVEAVPAVLDEQGNEVTPAVPAQEAVYETVEISPAVPAVTEEQTFPVYQQVNYMGLIGRMGTKVQQLQRALDAMEARLAALEAA